MLVRLLQYAALAPSQRSVLQGWYDDLTRGTLTRLPSRSRLLAEAVYQEESVGDRRAEARRKARAAEQRRRRRPPIELAKKPPRR